MPLGLLPLSFVRSSGDILTAASHGFDTGAGPFKIMNTANDPPSGLTGARRASTFATGSTVVATDEIVIDGKTYTFIATPASDGDVDVGANDTKSMSNLAAAINQVIDAGVTTYDEATVPNPNIFAEQTDLAVVTIFARTLDAAVANAIAVTSADLAVDNATLENGVDGTDYWLINLTANTFSLATTKALALAGTAVALADAGTGINRLILTATSLGEALEEVMNALTHPGARTLPKEFNERRFWQGAIDGMAHDIN